MSKCNIQMKEEHVCPYCPLILCWTGRSPAGLHPAWDSRRAQPVLLWALQKEMWRPQSESDQRRWLSSPLPHFRFLCGVFLSRAWDSSISHTCWLCSWNALTLITPLCTALNSMTAWPSLRSWTWALSSTSRMRWDAALCSLSSC